MHHDEPGIAPIGGGGRCRRACGEYHQRPAGRAAARLLLAIVLGLALAVTTRPSAASFEGPSALARACDSPETEWVYMGRLSAPFLPCPSR